MQDGILGRVTTCKSRVTSDDCESMPDMPWCGVNSRSSPGQARRATVIVRVYKVVHWTLSHTLSLVRRSC